MDEEEEPKAIEPTEPLEPEPAVDQFEASEPEDLEDSDEPGTGRSWLPTIAVGIAALVLGLLLGYMGRGQFGPEAQAARATETASAAAVATRSAANQELMKYLIGQARHAKGPKDATATIIEFSDFQ